MPNLPRAKETGYLRYFARRAFWKLNARLFRCDFTVTLPTGAFVDRSPLRAVPQTGRIRGGPTE